MKILQWICLLLVFILPIVFAQTQPSFCKADPTIGDESCTSVVSRYFWNEAFKECQQFIHTGCGGNQNKFDNAELCKCTCDVNVINTPDCGAPIAECEGDPTSSNCGSSIEKYFFNKDTYQCEMFRYGGCGGKNVHDTKEACLNKCGKLIPPNAVVCLKPRVIGWGNCSSSRAVWYYDQADRKCRPFLYSGCGSGPSPNMFFTLDDCERICNKFIQADQGRDQKCGEAGPAFGQLCPGANSASFIVRYYYNEVADACWPFYYYGCGGTANNFETEAECQTDCLPRISHCSALGKECREKDCPYGLIRDNVDCPTCTCAVNNPCENPNIHHCDPVTEKCRLFRSNQCRNPPCRFQTICEPAATVCTHPFDLGTCGLSVLRYYWNPAINNCAPMRWTGCGGNGNNFLSHTDCLRVCSGSRGNGCNPTCPTCTPPLTRVAQIINGCAVCFCGTPCSPSCGAGQTCQSGQCVASGGTSPCELERPANTNQCGLTRRYHFNQATRQCELFTYTGCLTTGNNFPTLHACINQCVTGCVRCTNTCGPNTRRKQVGNAPLGCQPNCDCEVCASCSCAPGQTRTYGPDGCCNGCEGQTCVSNCNSPCPPGQQRVPSSGSTCPQCVCRCPTCPTCPASQVPTGGTLPGSVCSSCQCTFCPACQPCRPGTVRSNFRNSNGCQSCECVQCPVPTCFCNIGQVPSSTPGPNGCPLCSCVPCSNTCPATCQQGTYSVQTRGANGCNTCNCVPCQNQGQCPAHCQQGTYSVQTGGQNGCSSCTCVPCPTCDQCPPGTTPAGSLLQNGCSNCQCIPQPCRACPACPSGTINAGIFENGCNTCQCRQTFQCNAFQCECQVGQVAELAWRDVGGTQCQICNCVSNPCLSNTCPPGQTCELNIQCDAAGCRVVPLCKGTSQNTVCTSSPSPGVACGQNPSTRWFYDPQSRQCFAFSFRGCGGNGNNFHSQQACLSTCQASFQSQG